MLKKIITIIIGFLLVYVAYVYWNAKVIEKSIDPETQVPASGELHTNIFLKENGLGVVPFGSTLEMTLFTLTPLLGAPTKDTGWVDSFSSYGTCPGEKIRGIEWNSLHLLFGDTLYGEKKFFGYEYVDRDGSGKPKLSTEQGITLGVTKVAIQAAYPKATFGEWLPGQIGTTFVRGAEGSGEYLGGTLENDKLFWIGGGIFCGE